MSTLRARGSATQQELDDATFAWHAAQSRSEGAAAEERAAESRATSSRAGSDAAAISASFAVVTAPFAGRITEKFVEPGNLVAPGAPLVRLESDQAFRLDVRIDEARASLVRAGEPVAVDVGRDERLTGSIVEVARAVDADARAFLVKVSLPADAGLTSGTFARATFAGPPRNALQVAASSLVRHGQVTSVFVVADGRARLRLVRVAEPRNGRVEVLAGLSAGEVVITDPPSGLADGVAVRVEGAR